MKLAVCIVCFALAVPVCAQESQLGADFRGEGERLSSACSSFSFGSLGSCAQVLFTDHPLHIAVGSIAPQNGFAAGPAFVAHWTPNENWRLSWDTDAVVSANGSWRAGAYMTAVLTRHRAIVVTTSGSGSAPKSNLSVQEYPAFHAYAQTISLNQIGFFGLGSSTSDTARSWFGMRETVVGGNLVWPVARKLSLSLFGEANGRFVALRGEKGQTSPSIEQIYTNATAPGLANQPGFAQFGEGVRLQPKLAGGYVRLNYSATLQEFAAANSEFSFRRFTADLSHQFPIYKETRTLLPQAFNGPDDCSADATVHKCPAVTRNREGSFGVRLLLAESFVGSASAVPFYFQPTLGGSDIDGNTALASYQDYRFRAPNLLLLSGSFEHSVYGPLGCAFQVDEGKAALTHGDVDFTHLAHSYSAGLTLRAGGFPMVFFLFAWGGHEGTHTIGSLNTSLLGGSTRPALY
jgi:hypothetical protein